MIKYRLVCNNCEIIFDSWFASSKEYEKLKKKKLLVCHNCNSQKVEKTLMAPQLIHSQKKLTKQTIDFVKYKKVKKTIKNYQKFIKENFKYVGENFTHEARSIHYGKKKITKNIYGNATKKDLKELKEEGINTHLIPWINDMDN